MTITAPVNLSLSAIRTDGGTQSRAALSDETVSDYAEAMQLGAEFPPIVVFHDGSAHWLADGFHRVFAAMRNGADSISAIVRQGAREDALWFALGANRENALRPTRGDVRHAVELALKTWPGKTQREIAAQVGCDFGYVSKIKGGLLTSQQLDAPATVTGKDGKVYPTSKPRKEKPVETQIAETRAEVSVVQTRAPESRGVALAYSMKAISFLQQIPPNDALRNQALDDVAAWIDFNR